MSTIIGGKLPPLSREPLSREPLYREPLYREPDTVIEMKPVRLLTEAQAYYLCEIGKQNDVNASRTLFDVCSFLGDLESVLLNHSKWTSCRASNLIFRNCDFRHCKIIGTCFRGSQFIDCAMHAATFINSDLSLTVWENTKFPKFLSCDTYQHVFSMEKENESIPNTEQ